MQIFISHSSSNADDALKICEFLETNGEKCFLAPRDIQLGKEYAEELINGIDRSDAMVLLMSAYANQSPHVLREVERAVSKSIPILVYKLEEVELSKSMEYFLMTHQWADAGTDGYPDVLRYVRDIKQKGASQEDAGQEDTRQKDAHSGSKKHHRIMALAACAVLAVGLGIFAVCRPALNMGFTASGIFQSTGSRAVPETSIEVGDTISFGSYNGEAIQWRVLKISDDGKEAVLIAKDILTMKAFDAAEGGKYNWRDGTDYWKQEADMDMELQAAVRGNSDWSVSNIRTWLNSSDEVVAYGDQPPAASAMAERKNGYNNEAGFLHGFTAEELSAIRETENLTKANALSGEDTVATRDRVYLLSREELQWFDDAGISTLAVPTQAAVEQDNSSWYLIDLKDFGIKEYTWWLRDPVEDMASKCYLVGNGYLEDNIRQENAGLEGFGIRPAVTVDLQSDYFREQILLAE